MLPIPYSEKVIQLANTYGCKLAPRSCAGGFLYDGKTLACYYQDWSQEEVNFCNFGKGLRATNWKWFDDTWKPIAAADILHDIAHHAVAEEWQRDLPEWGLGCAGDEFGANGGWHTLSHKEQDKWFGQPGPFMSLLDGKDADKQEWMAYLLGTYFCFICGLGSTDIDAADYWPGWIPEYDTGGLRHHIIADTSQKVFVPEQDLKEALDFYRTFLEK